MINTNILKILESNSQDPNYSIVISKFEQPTHCNKDRLKIYVQQFNPNLENIIEHNENVINNLKQLLNDNNIDIPDSSEFYVAKINSCIQKTLNIESGLDYNTSDGLYVSKLTGTLDNDINMNPTNRYVEGTIENRIINIIENDVPNYFSRNKFKIRESSFIISIPKKIQSFTMKLKELDSGNIVSYNEGNATNNSLNITIDPTKQYNFTIRYNLYESITSQSIETVVTPLTYNINIEFENTYYEIPAIILTMDKDQKVYSSYSTKFTKDVNDHYTGVQIEINGLKKQKQYGDLNITIIGKTGE